jgi:hypothetical protein
LDCARGNRELINQRRKRIMENRRRLKRAAVGLIAALTFGTVGSLPIAAKDQAASALLQVPVSGTASNGGTFQGTATITGFSVDGQNVVAVGTISGIVNGTQSIISVFSAPISQPTATAAAVAAPPAAASAPAPTAAPTAAAPAATCQILNLGLGPLKLNVLGLVISIPNPIVLNIAAVPGAGTDLGGLLCSVANGGQPQQVADQLNQILGVLNGL